MKHLSSIDYSLSRSDAWTANAALWSAKLGEDAFRNEVFRLMASRINYCVARAARPIRIIDVGCGDGAFLRSLKQKVPTLDLIGIDACAAFIHLDQVANEDIWYETVDLELRDARLPRPADVVVAILSLIEMFDLPSAISNVKRMLRPDGRFFFVVLDPERELARFRISKAGLPGSELLMVDDDLVISSLFEVHGKTSVAPYYRFLRPIHKYSSIALESGLKVLSTSTIEIPSSDSLSPRGVVLEGTHVETSSI